MMSLTFGLYTQVSGSGPSGPLVFLTKKKEKKNLREECMPVFFFILKNV